MQMACCLEPWESKLSHVPVAGKRVCRLVRRTVDANGRRQKSNKTEVA